MDIEKPPLFKEEYTYQDITKEIFLNQLDKVFQARKNTGDTELIIYNGECAATKMCDNCGKKVTAL